MRSWGKQRHMVPHGNWGILFPRAAFPFKERSVSTTSQSPAPRTARSGFPVPPPVFPQRGNRFSRGLARLLLRLFGWQVRGQLPSVTKCVVVGGPHTSNWDYVLTLVTMFALGVDVHYVVKHTFFENPLGGFLRWLGGVPVDRRAANNFVQQMVDQFASRERFVLAIMPEGTRSKVKGWRSGFYYIALGAGAPLVSMAFDFGNKAMVIGEMFLPTGDYETDLPLLQASFAGVAGKNPA